MGSKSSAKEEVGAVDFLVAVRQLVCVIYKVLPTVVLSFHIWTTSGEQKTCLYILNVILAEVSFYDIAFVFTLCFGLALTSFPHNRVESL